MRESSRDRLDKAAQSQKKLGPEASVSNKFGAINKTVSYKTDEERREQERARKRSNPAILARLLQLHREGEVCKQGTCRICIGQHKRRFYS